MPWCSFSSVVSSPPQMLTNLIFFVHCYQKKESKDP
uniref:Uncharacterized protein n=1 Tax=Arundo donax TaxID=35708 RepID=A0A0A8Z9F5_ARUDO